MAIFRLSNDAIEAFSETHELLMNVHIGTFRNNDILVIGGEIAVNIGTEILNDLRVIYSSLWSEMEAGGTFGERYQNWRSKLKLLNPEAIASPSVSQRNSLVALVMSTPQYVPAPPAAPAYVYGHLPFRATTTQGDAFLRFEPWPTSRRLVNGCVSAGTFAAPLSEQALVPNGFAAVGRYALPNLLPACTVWKIEPPGGTRLDVGTSVPLYGQAGGGAEVCFPQRTRNTTISNLPSLPIL